MTHLLFLHYKVHYLVLEAILALRIHKTFAFYLYLIPLRNQATSKINLLTNELNKLKDEIKNQSLISELSLKNKVKEAVTNLEKQNSSLTNSIEKMRLEHSINEKLIEEKFKSKISERDLTIQELRAVSYTHLTLPTKVTV